MSILRGFANIDQAIVTLRERRAEIDRAIEALEALDDTSSNKAKGVRGRKRRRIPLSTMSSASVKAETSSARSLAMKRSWERRKKAKKTKGAKKT